MFFPIGDDVNTRTLPVMATVLICINVFLWIHTGTLWNESMRAFIDQYRVVGVDEEGKPLIERRPLPPGAKAGDIHKWENFIREWGLVPTALAKGEYHGIMSHMFLHADFFHLLGNMLVFWAFVGTLEATLGGWTIFFMYLFWGMVAGVVQAAAAWGSEMPCIGASGAIAGVMGAYFLCFGALARIKVWIWLGFGLPARVVQVPAHVFLTLWVFFQVWGYLAAQRAGAQVSNVGWFAHLGGFAIGMLTMHFFKGDVQSKLTMNREGKFELKRDDQPLSPSGRRPALSDFATEMMPLEAEAAAAMAQPSIVPGQRKCNRCGTPIEDEHRVMEHLYRCPNCKMLVDLAPPPPPPSSSSRNRSVGGSGYYPS
jgi:membrane associated rhomboid family serine protease